MESVFWRKQLNENEFTINGSANTDTAVAVHQRVRTQPEPDLYGMLPKSQRNRSLVDCQRVGKMPNYRASGAAPLVQRAVSPAKTVIASLKRPLSLSLLVSFVDERFAGDYSLYKSGSDAPATISLNRQRSPWAD